jgi:hypothetical protein
MGLPFYPMPPPQVFMPSHLSHVDFDRVAPGGDEGQQQPQAAAYDRWASDAAWGMPPSCLG